MTETTKHYERVKQLMQKIPGQETPDKVTMPNADVRRLRAKLILEEAMETIKALGFTVYYDYLHLSDDHSIEFGDLDIRATHEPNLTEVADGCADISVVTIGTLIACGIPDETLLKMVDENNLAKFGPGSYAREDGKWIKPPDHRPPAIAAWLESISRSDEMHEDDQQGDV